MTITTDVPAGAGGSSESQLEQPYAYRRRELIEPDWTRLPGWRDVTAAQWADAQWQRAHCVKNVAQLRALMGGLLEDPFYADLERDQAERATMSSTSVRTAAPSPRCFSESWRYEAASRLSVSTAMRTSSGQSSGVASMTRAAWGSAAPSGSVTRCRPTGEDGVLRTRISLSSDTPPQYLRPARDAGVIHCVSCHA